MHRNAPALGEDQRAVIEMGTVAIFFVGKRAITVVPLEAGEAGLLALTDAAKVIIVGLLEPRHHVLHVLKDARVDGRICRERGADVLQLRFLLVAAKRDMATFPSCLALLRASVVQLTAAPENLV
jgi:hypothetical protein